MQETWERVEASAADARTAAQPGRLARDEVLPRRRDARAGPERLPRAVPASFTGAGLMGVTPDGTNNDRPARTGGRARRRDHRHAGRRDRRHRRGCRKNRAASAASSAPCTASCKRDADAAKLRAASSRYVAPYFQGQTRGDAARTASGCSRQAAAPAARGLPEVPVPASGTPRHPRATASRDRPTRLHGRAPGIACCFIQSIALKPLSRLQSAGLHEIRYASDALDVRFATRGPLTWIQRIHGRGANR